MALFNKKKNGGFIDVIRCDEPSYLIWKWHPSGTEFGESKRENAIRTNSVLRVKDGEVAVFVYKQKDGTMQDYIVGPFDQKIKTGNFPILSSIIGLLYEGDTPFQAEVYFINLSKIIQVKFGVPYFNVSDPRYPDFPVPVAVRGTITFKIDDYQEFIKLHRLDSFDLETFQTQIRDVVNRYVKDVVANAPAAHNIPVIQIESKTAMINDVIEMDIKERLREHFGVVVSGFDIGSIEIDKTSDEYQELKNITKDLQSATLKAQTEANIENYQETLRIQREEQQYAVHLGTQTANIGAYQAGLQAEVGIAGANALGQMGSNNVGNVDLGSGAGFNPMTMMAGMALGSAVGQNIANTMNGAMNGVNGNNIPPIPTVTYYVAKDGNPTGPYDVNKLKEMIISGEIVRTSLLWKPGMASWVSAETVEEIKSFFPPIIT